MNLRYMLLLFIFFCTATASAQGDEFLEVVGKSKDDYRVKALFDKVNLKFKYGDTGYTHGDTYVSESETEKSRYYLYAIVSSSVMSITLFHNKEGEGRPCPYALPAGITNDMTVAQMKQKFGTPYDIKVNDANTTYTSTDYTYYTGFVKMVFHFSSTESLYSTTLTSGSPPAGDNHDDEMKKYVDILSGIYLKDNPNFEQVLRSQTNGDVNDSTLNFEAGFTYKLLVIYDSLTVIKVEGALQLSSNKFSVKFTKNAGKLVYTAAKMGSATTNIFKSGTGHIILKIQNKPKAVAVNYVLYRYKTQDSKVSETVTPKTETKPAPVAEFPRGCKVKLVEVSKNDVANFYNDAFTAGMTGQVVDADLKVDRNGWFAGTILFSNYKTNYFSAAKFEKIK